MKIFVASRVMTTKLSLSPVSSPSPCCVCLVFVLVVEDAMVPDLYFVCLFLLLVGFFLVVCDLLLVIFLATKAETFSPHLHLRFTS